MKRRARKNLTNRWCHIDPVETPVDAGAAATTDATTDPAATPEVVEGGDKPTKDEAALAAFDKGMKAADAAKPGTDPEDIALPPKAGTAKVEAVDPAKKEADAKAEAARVAAESKANEGKKPEEIEAAKKAAEAVDKEIGDLQLKPKAAERFRELSKRPTPEAVEAQLAPLRARADQAKQWEDTVIGTGATPEQFGATVNYTALAVRANNGDMEAAKLAFQQTAEENAHWAKLLGMEAQGHDPLAAHQDLREAIENGDITKKHALEVAQARAAAAVNTTVSQRTNEQQQFQAAADGAMVEIGKLNGQLKAADPHFMAKLPLLQPTLDVIKSTMHPSAWPRAIAEAYRKIPNPAPAPVAATPTPTPQPLRPGQLAQGQQRKPKDAMEAFEMGMETVR